MFGTAPPARVREVVSYETDSEQLAGHHIDSPRGGDSPIGHSLTVSGWAVGRPDPVEAIEIVYEGEVLSSIPLTVERPDVVEHFPDLPGGPCGWSTQLSLVGLPRTFELFARALLPDGSRERLGAIRGERRPVIEPDGSRFDPVIVSTYGRTGSTWLMRLFDQHPATLAYRPFELEPRAISYWAAVLGSLASPASYLQPLATTFTSERWWIGDDSVPMDLPRLDEPVEAQLSRNGVEDVAMLCRERIRMFYEAAAISQSKPAPRYFVEKASPHPAVWRLVTELFPAAREIILVRDFRDMVCSILSYNAKTNVTSFGRERVETDADFVAELRSAADGLLHRRRRRGDSAFLLRYEDLILEPETTLTELFGFLDVNSSPEAVASVLERASRDTAAMAGHRTAKDPKASVGRWRTDLSPELQEKCAETLDDVLVEFGYEPTSAALA